MTRSKEDSKDVRFHLWPMWVVAGIAALLVIAYLIWFGVQLGQQPANDAALWGQFGDFIGGILNPIVAMFALLMLVRGVALQQETLGVTRRELEETRAVMRRQQFDSMFSSVMNMLSSLIAAPGVWSDIKKAYDLCTYAARNSQSMQDKCDRITAVLNNHERIVAPYTRMVGSAADLVLSSDLTIDWKGRYFALLRSLIPSHCAYLILLILIIAPENDSLLRATKEFKLLLSLPKQERDELLTMARELKLKGADSFPVTAE